MTVFPSHPKRCSTCENTSCHHYYQREIYTGRYDRNDEMESPARFTLSHGCGSHIPIKLTKHNRKTTFKLINELDELKVALESEIFTPITIMSEEHALDMIYRYEHAIAALKSGRL